MITHNIRARSKWVFLTIVLLIVLLIATALFLVSVNWDWLPDGVIGRVFRHQIARSVNHLEKGLDARWRNLSKLDLTAEAGVIPTISFNLSTRWPKTEKLPSGLNPAQLLTNAMNPGLGIRQLHRAGITGKGVKIAIIDYNIYGEHPEYAEQIAELYRTEKTRRPSMHGPAVASLLVGKQIGTAPQSRLYFVATPDDGTVDAAPYAKAVDWILEKNKPLPMADRIRVISVSASPSGKGLWKYRNTELWEEACHRAENSGVLVIEGAGPRAFVGPCVLDLMDPENPSKCLPVASEGDPEYFTGRLLVPIGPRTTAEEYYAGDVGYRYCGSLEATRLDAGTSWAIPYAAGVLALGWQLRPDLSAPVIKELLITSAHIRPDGKKIINPRAFIERVRIQ
jgi:serine protease AprX